MTKAVQCHSLRKIYGEEETAVEALRGVEMEVETGELLMIVGPSGSGKTTLLSVISSILHYDAGTCRVFGIDIAQLNEVEKTAFRKKNIGFVFQAFHLVPTWTALENATVPLLLNGATREEAYACGAEMLKRVGLEHRMHALPSHMSGGEQQRVAICRACIHEPRLILCDEPTSTLDHTTGIQVVELIREVAVRSGKAVVIVTHDARIFEFADRILEMEDGQIVKTIA